MQQSNGYVIMFAAGLTVVIGGLLSLAAVGLKDRQDAAKKLDTQKQILAAVTDISGIEATEISAFYEKRISSLVVNIEGDEVTENENGEPLSAEDVEIQREFKKSPEDRLYPVFKFNNEDDADKIDSYIIPVFGNGLWDNIWGYVALKPDLETINGVIFDHAGETPGLGARITEIDIQDRFKDRKIYDDNRDLVSVRMIKGEGNNPDRLGEHEVDGMSGATITANGINKMLQNYFEYYQGYFNKVNTAEEPGDTVAAN